MSNNFKNDSNNDSTPHDISDIKFNTDTKKHSNSRYHPWLHEQLVRWRQEDLISEAQASVLGARYPLPQSSASWGKVIVAAFGAIILGLGVILIFAYNWQGMHRFTKMGLVLCALIFAHGSAVYLKYYSAHGSLHKIGESLHLLGSMLFGAGIWLVAQIYHIDAHYPNGILLWSMGCLAMAWALGSSAQAFLALTFIVLWGGFELFDFYRRDYWAFWLIALGIAPLAYLLRATLLLISSAWLLALTYVLSTVQLHEDWILAAAVSLAMLYILGSDFLKGTQFADAKGAVALPGWIALLGMLFVFTFAELSDSMPRFLLSQQWWVNLHILLPVVAALVLLLYSIVRLRARFSLPEGSRIGLIMLSFILFIAMQLALVNAGFVIAASNLLLLGFACLFLVRGMKLLDWRRVAVGGLLLAILIFARFMDLFENLLLRAVIFMAIGSGLMFLAWFFSMKKNQGRKRTHV